MALSTVINSHHLISILWCLALLIINGSTTDTSDLELQTFFCQNDQNHHIKPIVITLNSSSTYRYNLSGTGDTLCSCIKEDVDVTIVSDSSHPVTVACGSGTGRFVFINATVHISNVWFINCGKSLSGTTYSELHPAFSVEKLSAHFIFVNSRISIHHVHFLKPNGVSILGINLNNKSIINQIKVSNKISTGTASRSTAGNGVLLFFSKGLQSAQTSFSQMSVHEVVNIHVQNSLFYKNSDININHYPHDDRNESPCLSYYYYNDNSRPKETAIKIESSLGLTIIYYSNGSIGDNSAIHVAVVNCTFEDNYSYAMGAMSVIHYNESGSYRAYTTVTGCKFNRNSNYHKCYGAGFSFYWNNDQPPMCAHSSVSGCTSIVFKNTSLCDNRSVLPHGINAPAFFGFDDYTNTLNVELIDLTCDIRNVTIGGSCIFAYVYYSVTNNNYGAMVLQDIQLKGHGNIKNFAYSGMFSFYGIANVTFSGNSTFHNSPISVIFGKDIQLFLKGNLTFSNNKGINGGAINVDGYSYVKFLNGVQAKFINNDAAVAGGAIYATTSTRRNTHNCAILLDSDTTADDIKITFHNNTAINAGADIFAYPVNRNHRGKYGKCCGIDCLANFITNNETNPNNVHVLAISTYPFKLNILKCSSGPTSSMTYAGKTMSFCMNATTSINKKQIVVYSSIHANIIGQERDRMWIEYQQQEQLLLEKEQTNINITIYTKVRHNLNGTLIFTTSKYDSITSGTSFKFQLQTCPLGFDLNDKGSCDCSKALFKFKAVHDRKVNIVCSIDNLSITWLGGGNSWAGAIGAHANTMAQEPEFGVSQSCPLGYCTYHLFNSFYSANRTIHIIQKYHLNPLLCLHNRTGVLCGACEIDRPSTVFGSTECKDCSNYWLLTIILYIAVGPLIVYLLFKLNLTLTAGTLNGVIFFANAANCGVIDLIFLDPNSRLLYVFGQIAFVFLSTLNLNLGFPLCFYNGMNELWKSGLSLLFPVYLLTIVVFLILISRYSTWLSNKTSHSSVQVLITIVHLSFSKLLLALFNVFASAEVYTAKEPYRVWYWDGNKRYMQKEHGILVGVSLAVIFPVLLPYLFILMFAKPLRRFSIYQYIRPVLEAIYGPYKNRKQHWFVLRLFLLMYMYSVYIACRSFDIYLIYVLTSPALLLYSLVQCYIKPFKSNLINATDSYFMFSLTLLYGTTWYFIFYGYGQLEWIVMSMSLIVIFIFFVIFILIVARHVAVAQGYELNLRSMMRALYNGKKAGGAATSRFLSSFYSVSLSGNHSTHRLINVSNSFYGSCTQYREPLLGHR